MLLHAGLSLLLTAQYIPDSSAALKAQALTVAHEGIQRALYKIPKGMELVSSSGFESRPSEGITSESGIDLDPEFTATLKQEYVVRDAGAWADLWRMTRPTTMAPRGLPYIDFSTEMVIAVIDDVQSSTGHGIEVSGVLETDNAFYVYVSTWGHIEGWTYSQRPTRPFTIVKMKRTEKQILFIR